MATLDLAACTPLLLTIEKDNVPYPYTFDKSWTINFILNRIKNPTFKNLLIVGFESN